jgi:hypothetical protein
MPPFASAHRLTQVEGFVRYKFFEMFNSYGTHFVDELVLGGKVVYSKKISKSASAGCWSLAAGRWPLAAGPWPLAAGRWLLAAGCWPLTAAQRLTVEWTRGAWWHMGTTGSTDKARSAGLDVSAQLSLAYNGVGTAVSGQVSGSTSQTEESSFRSAFESSTCATRATPTCHGVTRRLVAARC